METKIINLFAGAGAGKSTTAAGLFHQMKLSYYSVELVTEYPKELVWENNHDKLSDQLYLLAKQNRRIERLLGKVEYVITDCPLLLMWYYGKEYGRNFDILGDFIIKLFNKYNNINILINRVKDYVKIGRLGNAERAVKVDTIIEMLLTDNSYSYHNIDGDKDAPSNIIKIICQESVKYIDK